MSEARSLAERNLLPKVGAVFARGEDGEVLFTFTSDPSSIVGPRPAKASDRAAHPEAWQAFCAAEPAPSPKVESPPAGVAQVEAVKSARKRKA